MKKTDDMILDSLRKEIEKSAETANVPLRLQKDSIVAMLKNEQLNNKENENKDFSDKTGTNSEGRIIGMPNVAAATMNGQDENNSGASGAVAVKRHYTTNYISRFVAAVFVIVVAGGVLLNSRNNIKLDTVSFAQEAASQLKGFSDSMDLNDRVRAIFDKNSEQQAENLPVPALPETQASDKESSSNMNGEATADPNKPSVTVQGAEENGIDSDYADLIEVKAETTVDEGVIGENQVDTGITEPIVSNGYEADIVKSAGDYLYVVTASTSDTTGLMTEEVRIIKATPPEEMAEVSRIFISDHIYGAETVDNCIEIHIKDNILIAMISRDNTSLGTLSTVARFYNISDPNQPMQIREHIQDGEYVSSSLQGNNLCIVTDKTLEESIQSDSVLPSFSVNGVSENLDAKSEVRRVENPDNSYIFITVTDISKFDSPVGRLAVIGCGKNIYCSSDCVVIVREFVSAKAAEQGVYEAKTEISRFNIEGTQITSVGTQLVDGSLIGSVSVDKESGNLRAITSGGSVSGIYVFGNDMRCISAFSYPHDDAEAVNTKYIGQYGYIVLVNKNGMEETAIIDFSNPEKVKGERMVRTEGFSDSFRVISDELILAIKTEEVTVTKDIYVDSQEQNQSANGIDEHIKVLKEESKFVLVTLTLFDFSNPLKPKAVSSYSFEKENNIVFMPEDSVGIVALQDKNMFGVPVRIYNEEEKTESSAYMLFDVSEKTLDKISFLNHSDDVVGNSASRAICIGDVFYTVSGDKIVAFSVNDGKMISHT